MTEEPTCGKGLAANSVLAAKLGELTAAMAGNLEVHMESLDLDDAHARTELGVYQGLAEQQRQAAARLQAVAAEMAGSRDLPMGGHLQQALSSPEAADAFERFVQTKRELLALLQEMVEQDQQMLAQMRGPPDGRATP